MWPEENKVYEAINMKPAHFVCGVIVVHTLLTSFAARAQRICACVSGGVGTLSLTYH